MKSVRMLILALGLVILATSSSFAVVPFLTTSTTNIMAVNAQTGLAGSVEWTPMASGQVNAGEVVNLAFQGPISYLTDISVTVIRNGGTVEVFGTGATAGITSGGAWTAFGVTQTSSTSGMSVTVNQTSILIGFGSNMQFNQGTTDSIRVDGVRLDVSAFAVAGGLTQVSLSNTTGQALASSAYLTVGTFSEPLAFAVTPVTGVNTTTNAVNFYSNGAVNGGQNLVTVTLNEVFSNAFETKTVSIYAPIWAETRIKMTLSNIPTGMAITGVTLAGVNGATFVNGQTPGAFGTPAITTNPFSFAISSSNPNKLEGLQVGITFGLTSGTTTLALNASPITVTATLDPPGPTIASTYPGAGGYDYPFNLPTRQAVGSTYYTNGQLKYIAKNITTTIPVTITALSSNLFSVFSMLARNNTGTSPYLYNTGYAISNTSGSGFIYPAGQPGTITVTLYPQTGTPVSFTTSATKKPGQFLDSNGNLSNGQTWIVLLNDLLTTAGYSSTADFYGFIRFKANFQGAQGISYVSSSDPVTGEWSSSVAYPMISDQSAFNNASPLGSN